MRWCREQLIFHNISFRFVFGLFLGGPESRSAAAGLAWSPPTDEWNPGVPGVAVSPGLSRNPSSGPGGGGRPLWNVPGRLIWSARSLRWYGKLTRDGLNVRDACFCKMHLKPHFIFRNSPAPLFPWSRHHSAFDSLRTTCWIHTGNSHRPELSRVFELCDVTSPPLCWLPFRGEKKSHGTWTGSSFLRESMWV